ncbi:MAG: hypothetical protein HKN78_03630 [Sphingomonadaceae bacterium]|nr:hypothetical protein [Sphingomonadaceae bacterium]
MAQYFDRSEGVALDQVYKRGMSEEHPMVVDSFAISRSKSADEIKRWKTGFAGPNQRWHQRHPVVLIVISAAVGALLGEAVRQLSTLI